MCTRLLDPRRALNLCRLQGAARERLRLRPPQEFYFMNQARPGAASPRREAPVAAHAGAPLGSLCPGI